MPPGDRWRLRQVLRPHYAHHKQVRASSKDLVIVVAFGAGHKSFRPSFVHTQMGDCGGRICALAWNTSAITCLVVLRCDTMHEELAFAPPAAP